MLASGKPKIDDLIVRALATRPAQTASELLQQIETRLKNKPTTQGWYKALRRLLAQEVLIKDGQTYSLNTRWVLSVIRWAEQAEKTHLISPPFEPVRLPKGKQRITFHFKSLVAMDTFWGHLLVYIASQAKRPPTLWAYNHHFWFYLAHEQSEVEYNKGMREYGVKTRMLIGSDGFLDRWSTGFFDSTFKFWLHPVPLYKDETAIYNYLDGYFMEVKIATSAAKAIDQLFKETKNLDQISPLTLIRIFHSNAPCTLTISRAKTRGEALKSKVEKFVNKPKV